MTDRPMVDFRMQRPLALAWAVLAVAIGGVSLGLFGVFVLVGPVFSVELGLSPGIALLSNALLSLLFFAQHSGMVRRGFNERLATIVHPDFHRAVYATASGVVLTIVMLFWQESDRVVFAASGAARVALRCTALLALAGFAWGVRSLGNFDTFGVGPIRARLRGVGMPAVPFVARGPYRWVRHPLYLFMLVLIWSQPDVTVDRLVFNVLWTLWIVGATILEERDLMRAFGSTYGAYRSSVPDAIPVAGPGRPARRFAAPFRQSSPHGVIRSLCLPMKSRRSFLHSVAVFGGAAVFALALTLRLAAESGEPPVRFWDLPTGSRIAYARFPAPNQDGAIPFVFLHGGPGSYAVKTYASARPACERLAQRGFDVYLYDQVGSGFSNRLADPTEYTLDRHVADLEAIRQQIGSERMILLGASHGATLAANYLAAHPGRVAKAIFVSPGALDPAEHRNEVYSYPTVQLSRDFLQWIRDTRGREAARRYARFDALLRRDIRAAYAFAGDAEMDALMDAWVKERVRFQGVHDPARLQEQDSTVSGMGWWVGEMTLWDEAHRPAGVRAKLAKCDVPALILRGDADFLPAKFADEYAATFRQAKLVRIPAAGHLIEIDQPEAYRAALKEFLLGNPDSERPASSVRSRAPRETPTSDMP